MKYFAIIFFISIAFTACKPVEKSDNQIDNFIAKNKINAVKDSSGLYYQIIKAGTGDFTYSENTQITIKYEGRLLNGQVVDDGGGENQTFNLAQLIEGWRIGIPKIQKGGEIRLIIPPNLGYGNNPVGPIPGNSALDFTIHLINTQ